MQHDQLERRRRERSIGLETVARDQREADAEEEVGERDDGNGSRLSGLWALGFGLWPDRSGNLRPKPKA